MNRKFQKKISPGIISFILLACIIAALAGMSPPAAAAGTFRTTGSVHLRSEPTTESTSITVVNAGIDVEVLEHDPAGWSKVQVGNLTGYIRSDFLKYPTGDTAAVFRTTGGVNIRSAASLDSNVVGTVASGTGVEVIEHDPAGWSSIRADGVSGFIRSDFLTRGSGIVTPLPPVVLPPSGEAIAILKTTGTVNMRSGPSTDTNILRTLAANTSVEVLENRADGWSSVRFNGTSGYIKTELISEAGAPSSPSATTLKTTGSVNMRSGPSTSNSIIVTLAANTSVEVLDTRTDGWSNVRFNGRDGFIRSDLLASSAVETGTTLRTVTGVNFRTGPSKNHSVIRLLTANTAVEVLENQANGWSRVKHNGTEGFIRSDLLGTGTGNIELLDWSSARNVVPTGVNMRVVDVRTGISFNLRGFAKSGHLDVEPPTKEDTEAILKSRNGVWAWAPRPVWVTIGSRTFAAALNGMPHDVSTIRDNGIDGHFCLHFNNTVTNSKTYQRDLNNAVMEAYEARPR